jgi:gas vesicle protein
MKSKKGSLAVWSLILAGGSYVAGLLTAPKSGESTRKDINTAAQKAKKEAEDVLKSAHSELNELIAKCKIQAKKSKGKVNEELHTVVKSAETVKTKAREILSAVHEGEASNAELDKAVKEAKEAIKNLKTFIKK